MKFVIPEVDGGVAILLAVFVAVMGGGGIAWYVMRNLRAMVASGVEAIANHGADTRLAANVISEGMSLAGARISNSTDAVCTMFGTFGIPTAMQTFITLGQNFDMYFNRFNDNIGKIVTQAVNLSAAADAGVKTGRDFITVVSNLQNNHATLANHVHGLNLTFNTCLNEIGTQLKGANIALGNLSANHANLVTHAGTFSVRHGALVEQVMGLSNNVGATANVVATIGHRVDSFNKHVENLVAGINLRAGEYVLEWRNTNKAMQEARAAFTSGVGTIDGRLAAYDTRLSYLVTYVGNLGTNFANMTTYCSTVKDHITSYAGQATQAVKDLATVANGQLVQSKATDEIRMAMFSANYFNSVLAVFNTRRAQLRGMLDDARKDSTVNASTCDKIRAQIDELEQISVNMLNTLATSAPKDWTKTKLVNGKPAENGKSATV